MCRDMNCRIYVQVPLRKKNQCVERAGGGHSAAKNGKESGNRSKNLSELSLEVLLHEVEEDLVGPMSLGKGSTAEVNKMATHEEEAVTREKIGVDRVRFSRQLIASTAMIMLSLIEESNLRGR